MQQRTLNLLNHLSVLVVEDDELARVVIKENLEDYCEAFYEAADGLAGLELFKKHRIDIIITDIHLPGINGFEMIKEILTLKPNQTFIVMTSYVTDQNLVNSIHQGACSFFRKPLDIQDLQTALLLNSAKLGENTKQLSTDITIDYRKEVIYKNGSPVFLSHKGNQIFWLLCYNLGNLVTYAMIEDYVYSGESVNQSTISTAIGRIKQQLGNIAIENVSNGGYVLKITTDEF